MLEPNGSHWPPGLDGRTVTTLLLNNVKLRAGIRLGCAGVILFAGLSGPSWAAPQSAQSGNVETGISRDFSATPAITRPEMIVASWSEMGDARTAPLEYDADLTVASGTSSVPIELKVNNVSSNSPLMVGSDSMSRFGDAEAVAVRASGVVLAAAAYPGAGEASLGSAPTGTKGKRLEAENVLPGEAPKYPYGTVTLAVLALLGLVSVARRGDKV
jgi:hypothetical protein